MSKNIFSILYSFHIMEMGDSEICGTSYTDHDKAMAYMQSKISAVKNEFTTAQDDKSHIKESMGINKWTIENTTNGDFASLTIEVTELVED